jgi:PAS domain S-box-containing protein
VNRFGTTDLRLIESLAAPAATAIENARLYGQAQREIAARARTEEELRESEARFRLLAENIQGAFWMADAGLHKTYYASPGYETVYGLPCGVEYEWPGSFLSVVHPRDREALLAALERQQEGHVTNVEYRVLHPDGLRWVRDRGFPIFDNSGKVYRVAGIALDITEQVQARETLQRHNRELALLNQAAQAFTSTLDLDQVLGTILDEVRSLLEAVTSGVWLIDPATDELICRQATGPVSEVARGWRLAPGQGFAGWVARHGESLIVPDAEADGRRFRGVSEGAGLDLRWPTRRPTALMRQSWE